MKITISSTPGAGKSTIAQLITKTLQQEGFTVINQDIDDNVHSSEPEYLNERIKRAVSFNDREDKTITVTTELVKRTKE